MSDWRAAVVARYASPLAMPRADQSAEPAGRAANSVPVASSAISAWVNSVGFRACIILAVSFIGATAGAVLGTWLSSVIIAPIQRADCTAAAAYSSGVQSPEAGNTNSFSVIQNSIGRGEGRPMVAGWRHVSVARAASHLPAIQAPTAPAQADQEAA